MKNINYTLRKIHYWGAIIAAIPIVIVIITGILLQVKKQSTWVQPKTIKGSGTEPQLSFAQILEIVEKTDAKINSWQDVDRLEVRPGKGVIKIRGKNRWEVQIDASTGTVLQIAYRRSDLIESVHDGSFFHSEAKLWLFLPSAIVLLILWVTGMYLFFLPIWRRSRKKRKNKKA
ncbi:PepSY domain-containing protein [Candidatus Uabimicrobium sp. HlEnr_7]|uniref:PepSY domain-containing protein n=1 Tax=Candidatus Uabimicrobium helgolandensis TaxID=3095367 RepID=UPI0035577246